MPYQARLSLYMDQEEIEIPHRVHLDPVMSRCDDIAHDMIVFGNVPAASPQEITLVLFNSSYHARMARMLNGVPMIGIPLNMRLTGVGVLSLPRRLRVGAYGDVREVLEPCQYQVHGFAGGIMTRPGPP